MVKMMFVDDNLDERMLLKRHLSKMEVCINSIEASGGQDAIDKLKCMPNDELPALVLLDLKMPKVDGLQVLQWIRSQERIKHIPVVMFSTSDDKQDIKHSYELGANSYVVKDIHHHACLDILLVYWNTVNLPPN